MPQWRTRNDLESRLALTRCWLLRSVEIPRVLVAAEYTSGDAGIVYQPSQTSKWRKDVKC
jgi:hypothetical protein